MAEDAQFSPIREALTSRLQELSTPEGQLGGALRQVGQNQVSLVDKQIPYRDVRDSGVQDQISAYDALAKAQEMGNPDAKAVGQAFKTFGVEGDNAAKLAEWLDLHDGELTPQNIMTMTARGYRELGLKGDASSDSPSAVREYQFFNNLSPQEKQDYLRVKRSDQFLNLGGKQRQVGLPDGISPQSYAVTPKQSEMPEFKADVAGAEQNAKIDAEKRAGYAKANAALVGLQQQNDLVTGTIDKAINLIDKPYSASTGYARLATGGGLLPNTDARELDNYLNTIKANIGFDKLQQMRENSPTGGALGQVSDFENKLLQAVNGALDPGQRDQLKANLASIRDLYPRVLAEKRSAFQHDYGRFAQQDTVDIPKLPVDAINQDIPATGPTLPPPPPGFEVH